VLRDMIKSQLTMKEIFGRYAPERKVARGRSNCPLHMGDNLNFQLYEKSFYCFKCHTGGDQIKFVAELFRISYAESIKRIAADFGLVAEKQTLTQYRQAKQLREKLKRENEKEREEVRDFFVYLVNIAKLCEKWVLKYKPNCPELVWHPRYCFALEYQHYADYLYFNYTKDNPPAKEIREKLYKDFEKCI